MSGAAETYPSGCGSGLYSLQITFANNGQLTTETSASINSDSRRKTFSQRMIHKAPANVMDIQMLNALAYRIRLPAVCYRTTRTGKKAKPLPHKRQSSGVTFSNFSPPAILASRLNIQEFISQCPKGALTNETRL